MTVNEHSHHRFKQWLFDCSAPNNDVTMGAMASQITSLMIVYSIIYSDAGQRKHQSSASLAFVWGIHRGPANSPHRWPVTRKMFTFDDVIMAFPIVPSESKLNMYLDEIHLIRRVQNGDHFFVNWVSLSVIPFQWMLSMLRPLSKIKQFLVGYAIGCDMCKSPDWHNQRWIRWQPSEPLS